MGLNCFLGVWRDMSCSSQFVRHLKLLKILSRNTLCGRYTRIKELTGTFDVSRRTIYRDLDVLEQSGFSLAGDEKGSRKGVKLLSPLKFSEKELNFNDILEIHLSGELLSLRESDPDTYIRRLLSDLECTVDDTPISTMKRVKSLVQVHKPAKRKYLSARSHFDSISMALRSRRKLKVHYYSAHRASEDCRIIHPYKCTWNATTEYVEAFCEKASGMRTFAVNRMKSVTLLDEHFVKDPRYEDYSNQKGFILYDGEAHDVCLLFDAEVAYHAQEREWFAGQATKVLADGRVEIRFSASGLKQMAGFVMRWGGAIEVVEPTELRKLVCVMVQRCAVLRTRCHRG